MRVHLQERFPLLPVEKGGRLHDPVLRENFITRIFPLQRWRKVKGGLFRRGGLVAFHSRHKLLLLSHSPAHYRTMGKLVADQKSRSEDETVARFETLLMEALRLKSTLKKHVNVLQHMMVCFKKQLTSDEKKELLETIYAYQQGLVPLIVPLTLIGHYIGKYDQPYLKQQAYLYPHPLELKLRNHA